MSYYQFNWQEILQKANNGYCKKKKKKGAEYHWVAIKRKSKNQYKNFTKEEKDQIKKYQRKRY